MHTSSFIYLKVVKMWHHFRLAMYMITLAIRTTVHSAAIQSSRGLGQVGSVQMSGEGECVNAANEDK